MDRVCGHRKVCWFLFHFQITIGIVTGLSPLWDSVTTSIVQEYDVHEGNEILTVRVNMGEYRSTDLVVGEDIRADSRLILTCVAHHGPSEWVYSGDGDPTFVQNKTIQNGGGNRLSPNYMNGAKRYVAILTLGASGLSPRDTGRYNCMTQTPEVGSKYKTLSAYYHVYVPEKSKLFLRQSETVFYDLNKSAARIPCGVNNPKASVTLQKFVEGALNFIPHESMLYHPISGFYPKKDIPGTYLCTAGMNGTFDFVHFILDPKRSGYQHRPFGKGSTKRPNTPEPEDLEWLMYPSSGSNTFRTTKPPLYPEKKFTSPKFKYSTKRPTPAYVPFHLRYTGRTTTYAPFQTFQTIQTTSPTDSFLNLKTNSNYNGKIKTNRPFDPSKYPSEIFSDAEAGDADNYGLPFPVSYRPSLSYTTTRKPSRTTPRRYRPPMTTPIPVRIPESVICSQFQCGLKAVCYATMYYNESSRILNADPGCKCLPNHVGNPYSECYEPSEMPNPNLLLFNITNLSVGRSPLEELMAADLEDDNSNESENRSDRSDLNLQDGVLDKTTVDIIDM